MTPTGSTRPGRAARALVLVLPVVLAALLAPPTAAPAPAGEASLVRVYRHEGMIHDNTAHILERALETAANEKAALFVLELDTPGGLVTSTEEIVRTMLNSRVPIATWVGPRGAHAASAGFFLLLAADVAAMAPVTRTGASAVINATGDNKEGDIALKKASADLQALIRSAARMRGRPADLAEQAVRDARSWTEDEALEDKLIDVVAASRAELLERLDGRTVARPDGTTVVLHTKDARVVEHTLAWSEDVKNILLYPTVIALMLSLAALGIYAEMTHPGLILPGVVGGIALLVFLYASNIMPVSMLAALLVVAGIIAFILEIKVVSYGLLGISGTLSIALGLWLLFPSDVPGLQLPVASLVTVLAVLVGGLTAVTVVVRRTLRLPPTTGREGIVGEVGRTLTALAPEGTIFVHGEIWKAQADRPVAAGAAVRVVRSEGLTLYVEPCETGTAVPATARRDE